MSTALPEHSRASAGERQGGMDYAALMNEAKSRATGEDYEAQAADMLHTIQRFSARRGLREGYDAARKAYVEEEDNRDLRQFAAVMLFSPDMPGLSDKASVYQAKREELRTEGKDLPPAQLDDYYAMRRKLGAYQHGLREVVMKTQGEIEPEQVSAWLERFSRNEPWSRSILQGVASEVAAYRYLSEFPGVQSVRFGTVTEDTEQGIDMVATLDNGQEMLVDVKSGGSRPEGGVRWVNGRLEFGLPRQALQGFELTEGVKDELEEQVIQELESVRHGRREKVWSSNGR